MSYLEEKDKTIYSSKPVSSNPVFPRRSRNSGFESLADFEKKDLVYKRRIRILRFVSRFASLILNAYLMGSLSYALTKYFLTKNHVVAGNVHPWAVPTTLWPTIMLLSIATITFIMNFITLCTYMCGVGAANRTSSVFSYIGYIMLAAHVVVWAVAMGLFKMANTGKDLWGYSCGPEADAIQEQVKSFVNFGKLCTLQSGSWYTSIVETITYGTTFVVTILMARRASHKKKMAKMRESTSMEAGYMQNTQDIEMETTYKPGTGKRYMPVSVEYPHV